MKNTQIVLRLVSLLAMLAVTVSTAFGAPPLKVSSATPSSTYQGTIDLDVIVSGSGFDGTAKVQYFVSGTTNPGGITVKKTIINSGGELLTTIDVADNANIASYDIVVTQDGGRKGKGTTLFAVQSRTNDPCAVAGLDFPAFMYSDQTPKGRQIYLADASGKCSRPLYLTAGNPGAFSYPVAGSSDVGIINWREGDSGIYAMTFRVSGTSVIRDSRRLVHDFAPIGLLDTDLSQDGTNVYAALDAGGSSGSATIVAVNVNDGSQQLAYVGPPDGSAALNVGVDEFGALIVNQEGTASGRPNRLLRVVPPCTGMTCGTVLLETPYGIHGFAFPEPSLTDDRIVYGQYLTGLYGCWSLHIVRDAGGPQLYSSQPRYVGKSTWYRGKILTQDSNPPNGAGKCYSTGFITQIDPDTGAAIPLVKGGGPDAR